MKTAAFISKHAVPWSKRSFSCAVLFVSLCSRWALPASAQDTLQPLNAQQAVAYAREHSRIIRSAQMEERIAREKTKEVLSSGLPQVNINGRYTDNL